MELDIEQLCKDAMDAVPLWTARRGVYFLFAEEGALVYVGRGQNCLLRVAEHTRRDSGKVFSGWNFLPIDDEQECKRVEDRLIRKYRPLYNAT